MQIQTPPDQVGFFGSQSHPCNVAVIPFLGHTWILRVLGRPAGNDRKDHESLS